jgi:hypothetical protein
MFSKLPERVAIHGDPSVDQAHLVSVRIPHNAPGAPMTSALRAMKDTMRP